MAGEGRSAYAQAHRLLICADGPGSNGYELRLWKTELARLASETSLEITVCHLPPGTSKWITSHEVVVDLIGATTTRQGLRVNAELDRNLYPTKVTVSDQELAQVPITRHDFHGKWNYRHRAGPISVSLPGAVVSLRALSRCRRRFVGTLGVGPWDLLRPR